MAIYLSYVNSPSRHVAGSIGESYSEKYNFSSGPGLSSIASDKGAIIGCFALAVEGRP